MRSAIVGSILLISIFSLPLAGQQNSLKSEASDALKRSVGFFHQKVAAHGGYVYRYSPDLSKREGEGKTGPDTVWVQPPGTPAVGMAYVDAYDLTGEQYLLDAARDAGICLVRGQLRSGGWTNNIEFAPEQRIRFSYRVDQPSKIKSKKRSFNTSTFDDDKSQSAVRFLSRLDRSLGFKDEQIHESVTFALDSFLKAQFPNGAWPQGYSEYPDPSKHDAQLRASYPESWPRTCPGGDYWHYYTFNDNTIADTIDTLLLAAEVYDEPRYREAALKAGDFILLAQMPEPQTAWAQQYNFEMQPVWARKFEPAAVSGSESQGLIQILMQLYVETGDKKYLGPIPSALAYLKSSVLPDGRLARFYELKTNKPLYFTRKYELTYDDSDLPTHYGFKVSSKLDSLQRQFDKLLKMSPAELQKQRRSRIRLSKGSPSDSDVQKVIGGLDERGAWVEEGRLTHHGKADDTRQIIASQSFIRNIGTLSQYVARLKE